MTPRKMFHEAVMELLVGAAILGWLDLPLPVPYWMTQVLGWLFIIGGVLAGIVAIGMAMGLKKE